jgi:hypothetical protein
MKGYQIIVSGHLSMFNSRYFHHSKDVYLSPPTEDIINSFIDRCCNPQHEDDWYYIKREGVEYKVVEVNIVGGD